MKFYLLGSVPTTYLCNSTATVMLTVSRGLIKSKLEAILVCYLYVRLKVKLG